MDKELKDEILSLIASHKKATNELEMSIKASETEPVPIGRVAAQLANYKATLDTLKREATHSISIISYLSKKEHNSK